MEAKTRSGLKEVLEEVVDELVRKGILWPEASAQFEKLFIVRVLAESNGNLGRAAEIMGVHRNTFSKKLREHQIRAKEQKNKRAKERVEKRARLHH